jgi:molybdopterin molybdotransferase
MALMPVADALAKVLAGVEPLSGEFAPLIEAHGRVLAADLKALRTQPPADVSAMDGYAVRGADVAGAPARLTVIGEVAAGRPFNGEVGPGQAARIFTGGVVPCGADTVVIQEVTERADDVVIVNSATPRGRNVRAEGLDFKRGATLLFQGERLTSRSLALAAAMNHPQVPVHRRPMVALLATGDELVTPGTATGPGQIVSSNGFALGSLIRHEGAEVTDLGIVGDELDTTVAAIERARAWGADVLVTAGGASVGEHDLVQQALTRVGLQLAFWKVALRPGKPLLHGRIGDMRVLGVPGNPVSAFVCAFLFVVPLIRLLSGRTDLEPRPESATLGIDLPENDERRDYLRASLDVRDGLLVATPFRIQDSSMMAPLAQADCLVIRDPFAAAAPAGSPCAVLKLGL